VIADYDFGAGVTTRKELNICSVKAAPEAPAAETTTSAATEAVDPTTVEIIDIQQHRSRQAPLQ
jgi:hypothetical protein